jgi:hypothetical protein
VVSRAMFFPVRHTDRGSEFSGGRGIGNFQSANVRITMSTMPKWDPTIFLLFSR